MLIITENTRAYQRKGIFKIINSNCLDILILVFSVTFAKKIISAKGKYNLRQVNRRNRQKADGPIIMM